METPARVSLVPTPSGLQSLRVRRPQGGFVSLHSMHDPWEEASRFADSVALTEDTGLVIVLGLGLGYHVLALAHRLRAALPSAGLWAVEMDDDVLDTCLKSIDLGLLFKLNEARLLSHRSLSRLHALEGDPPAFGIQVVRHAASHGLAPEAYAPWESGVEELSARRRLNGRAPGLVRRLSGGGTAVLKVSGASREAVEAGPPYGAEQTAIFLLERVHRYE